MKTSLGTLRLSQYSHLSTMREKKTCRGPVRSLASRKIIELGKISVRTGEEYPITALKMYLGRKGFQIEGADDDRIAFCGVSDSTTVSRVHALIELLPIFSDGGERYDFYS